MSVLVVLLLGIGLVGCDSGTGPSDGEQVELHADIVQLAEEGARARLADLTNFEWDTVYVYPEGTRVKEIEREVGGELPANTTTDYLATSVMVFVRDGNVVRSPAVPELVFSNADNQFNSEVRLVPTHQGKRSPLELVEG